MTNKNSICAKCKNLDTDCNSFTIGEDNNIGLIAHCVYGGKNAGNRKMCKKFKEASTDIVENRANAFNQAEKILIGYNSICNESEN